MNGSSPTHAVRFRVHGRVQGVGFRYFVLRAADGSGVTGWVRNRPDGTVEALARGNAEALQRFRSALWSGPPRAAVTAVDESEAPEFESTSAFEIR